MIILSLSLLGIILGVFFTYDLVFKKKKDGSFVRAFSILITATIPAIYQGIFGNINIDEQTISVIFIKYFYTSFIGIIFISIFIIYQTTYKSLMKEFLQLTDEINITFLDFLYSGYYKFKVELQENKTIYKKKKQNKEKEILSIIETLNEPLKYFFREMITTIGEETKTSGFITTFIIKFINEFFGKNNARFTFRKLAEDKNQMETYLTTSTKKNIPGPIPLNKKNLITLSYELGRPVLYSENKQYHYKTKKNSHGKKIYNDYVSYALIVDDDKIYYSFSLDVKGEEATSRLQSLVKTQIFLLICNIFELKILKSNGKI